MGHIPGESDTAATSEVVKDKSGTEWIKVVEARDRALVGIPLSACAD